MIINSSTKISAILKANPDALEAIVAISPKLEKLRNPILRKIMAGKASVAMASKIAGCTVQQFADKLKSLGFEMDVNEVSKTELVREDQNFPDILETMSIRELDVRPMLDKGHDPFKVIMAAIGEMQQGQGLKILNTFEPTPLISILKKQGFESYTDFKDENFVETYFFKAKDEVVNQISPVEQANSDWHQLLSRFEGQIRSIDVRNMEMPEPMMTILAELDTIKKDELLFVFHKRIPLFLLPELKERNFQYRFKEISDSETHLLIFRN